VGWWWGPQLMDHTIKPDSQAHATAANLFLYVTYCHRGNKWFSFIVNLTISRIKCFPNAFPEERDVRTRGRRNVHIVRCVRSQWRRWLNEHDDVGRFFCTDPPDVSFGRLYQASVFDVSIRRHSWTNQASLSALLPLYRPLCPTLPIENGYSRICFGMATSIQ
jgi:hypothetical protein